MTYVRCAVLIVAMVFARSASAADTVNVIGGLALRGYDPVAYFTQHKPVKGDPQIVATYDNVIYRFANTADLKTFDADPKKYMPAYGGFCAYAVGLGHKVDADPKAFVVYKGKLYVNYNDDARKKLLKNLSKSLKAADKNWPNVEKSE